MERLQKILARGGISSRRAAEQLITNGRVRVNGRIVTELGAKADPRQDRVEVDGKRVVAESFTYILIHKPRGVVSTMSDPEGRPTVRELLPGLGGRVYPVGRLDFATSGALLATNDGEFADGLLHPRKSVPKTYVLKVKGVMQPDDVEHWRRGIKLEDGMTLPAEARIIRHEGDKTWLELTIREGRNQQIRRMGEATRFPVMRLARTAFAGVDIEGLAPGKWRPLTREELTTLKKAYGVPRSVGSNAATGVLHTARPPRAQIRTDARGTASHTEGHRDERGARDRKPTGREGAGRDRKPTGREDAGRHRKPTGRDEAARPTGGRGGGADAPRYGGGSPGRRDYEVTRDWSGGSGRGRSDDDRPRAEVGGGRGGRTRTTGTSGGIGARGPTDRVKSRRG